MKTTTNLLITMIVIASMFCVTSQAVAGSTINVPNDYSTIQAAINAAAPGDVIQVSAQTYYENLVVNKNVQLIGDSPQTTIIDGSGTGTVVDVYADNVYISGFTIRNSGVGIYDFESGVHAHSSTSIVIFGNKIADNEFGVWLDSARNSFLRGNEVTHNMRNAIYLRNATGNTISENIIANNTYGLRLENGSSYNFIHRNTIANSSFLGIRLDGKSNNNVVHENTLGENDFAVYLSSSLNIIYENTLRRNFYAIYSLSSIEGGNVLYRNNFIENTVQVSIPNESLVEAWDNGLEGNYWSGYGGVDLNGDGVGDTDTPHEGYDWFPLMKPWRAFRAFNVVSNGDNYVVTTHSNSTIASFDFNQSLDQISFNATGPSRALGICNVTIPRTLLESEPLKNWSITLDGINTVFTLKENSTHTSLYFSYDGRRTRMVRARVMLIENPYPIAEFTHLPLDPTLYDTINFTDMSTDPDGQIISRNWDFGDGSTSTEQNPRHKYMNEGPYVVTLTVEDDRGAKTATSNGVPVRKVVTSLTINAPSTSNRGETITITAILKDEIESFLQNAIIRFYIFKQGEWESIGSNETNTSGAALISHTALLEAGTYHFRVTFDGTKILAETSVIFTIEIKDVAWTLLDLPWWLIPMCSALVITAALAAAVIWRKRRTSASARDS